MRDGPWSTDHGISDLEQAPGELTIEDLQYGCCGIHRGYRYKLVLAILNLHVAPMFPMAQSDLPYGSRLGLKIFKMATLGTILDIGTERF